MNELDWVLFVVIGIFVVSGLLKGLLRLVFAVVAVVIAIVLAGRATGVGTGLLARFVENPAVAAVAAFVLIFMIVLVAMALLARVLSKAVQVLGLGWVDRLGGAALGLAAALLVVGVVFLVVDLAGLEKHTVVRESTLAPVGWRIADGLRGVFPEGVRERIEDRGEQFNGIKKAVDRGREQIENLSDEVEKLKEKKD